MKAAAPDTVFTNPEALPLRPPEALAAFGKTLVVAPHPDDESLGCGGLIALLRRQGTEVHVLVVTDGTQSHPNSPTYPPPKLRALREQEAARALRCLQVPSRALSFLRLKDSALPLPGSTSFPKGLDRVMRYLRRRPFHTVLFPWCRDPHHDHRATWHLVRTATRKLESPPRLIEYPIWGWTQPDPPASSASAWRLDIHSVLAAKKKAIAAYRSQTTGLIDDDPDGFQLTPQVRAYFERPWELYFKRS